MNEDRDRLWHMLEQVRERDIHIRELEEALEELNRECDVLQQAGGATIYTKEQVKARLDGFVMTVQDIVTEALKENK